MDVDPSGRKRKENEEKIGGCCGQRPDTDRVGKEDGG